MQKEESVRSLLSRLGLERYNEVFEEEAITDVSLLVSMGADMLVENLEEVRCTRAMRDRRRAGRAARTSCERMRPIGLLAPIQPLSAPFCWLRRLRRRAAVYALAPGIQCTGARRRPLR